MQAIMLFRLGVPETDDIIRQDAWLYSAVRLIRIHAEERAAHEAERQRR
jgi:hypothetical protein